MKRFVTAARSAVAFLFASLMFTAMAEVTPDDYAKKLTITLSDAVGEGGLENFPVLVRLSESIQGFKYADFKEDGADMIFTDEAGKLLSHEVDTWDASGTSLVWVKIPSAQAGVKIVCYFGGPSAAETVDPTAVWSNYTGVWHMGETKRGTYDEAEYDMVPNATGLAGTDGIVHGDTQLATLGRIGGSADIATVKTSIQKTDGLISNLQGDKHKAGVFVPASADLGLYGQFAFSCWMRQKEADFGWQRPFGNQSESTGFNTDFKSNGTHYNDKYYGTDNSGVKIYFNGKKIVDKYLGFTPILAKDEWHYLTFVFDNRNVKLYEDGVCIATETAPAAVKQSTALLGIGNYGARFDVLDGAPWGGYIDEFRIYSGVPSAERIAAEYAAVENDEVLSYGYVEDVGLVYYPVNLTVPSGSVTYSVEPHHYQDEVPCFLSGTELTITAVDETAVRFRKWRGDTENAIIDENYGSCS